MSNILNKNHPFRSSVTHDGMGSYSATGSVPRDQATASTSISSEPEESRFEALKTKVKIFGGITAGILVVYIWLTIYDALIPGNSADQAQSSSRYVSSSAEEQGEDYENRDVEEIRYSHGILGRFFCRGGRRSSFCD